VIARHVRIGGSPRQVGQDILPKGDHDVAVTVIVLETSFAAGRS
jgi:hypothetical protein